jgi:hypothetical protein
MLTADRLLKTDGSSYGIGGSRADESSDLDVSERGAEPPGPRPSRRMRAGPSARIRGLQAPIGEGETPSIR